MAKKSSKLTELHCIFMENDISAETIEKNDNLIFEIKKRAASIKDYRHESYVRHLLVDVVMITFFALLSNANEWADIEIFAKSKEKWLRKYLELPFGIPTDDTIRLIIGNIDSAHFYSLTITFLMETIDQMLRTAGITSEQFGPDIIAVDGKESRGSKRNKTDSEAVRALQTLNVFSNSYQMCIAQQFIDEKTNEIPAAQELLELMDLSGDIVTADAMNCQKETAACIIRRKGDYVLAVKGNQKNLYEDIKDYFDEDCLEKLKNKESGYYKTVEKEHGGVAVREYFITEDVSWYYEKKKWEGLKTFGMVKKTLSKKNGETEVDCRYYICSIEANAMLFERAVRKHWGVENNLHWMLDFTFKDDKNTSMAKTSAKNMQLMKKIVMAVLGIVKKSYKLSMTKIRYKLSLDYEREIEKMLSLLSVSAIEEALSKKSK